MTCESIRRFLFVAVAMVSGAFALPAAAQSPDSKQLTARIVDSNGAPVANYPVVIQQISDRTLELYEETANYSIEADDWTVVVATDRDGMLVLPELPSGGTYAIVPVSDPKPYLTLSAPPRSQGIFAKFLAPDDPNQVAKVRPTMSAAEISSITGTQNIDLSKYSNRTTIEIQLTD